MEPVPYFSCWSADLRLRFQPGDNRGVWSPDAFTSLVLADEVPEKTIKRRNREARWGGTLIGVQKETPQAPFAPRVGITAPVTALLKFQSQEAVLSLHDSSIQQQAKVEGVKRPLAADFSAPLAYYPAVNETVAGFMGGLQIGHYMERTGLYML